MILKLKKDVVNPYGAHRKEYYTIRQGSKMVEKSRDIPKYYGKENDEVTCISKYLETAQALVVENKQGERFTIKFGDAQPIT